MSAYVTCSKCKAHAHMAVLEDDYTTGSLVLDDDVEWEFDDEPTQEQVACDHSDYQIVEMNNHEPFD